MTIVAKGLDYSGGVPSGSAVKAAGYGFVARYLANGLSGRANLTDTEAADMERNGVDVVLVWERKQIGVPDRATQGAAAGAPDAQAALAQAAAVGRPTQPIYFCVDFDIPDYAPGSPDARAKLGSVGDYLAAARDVVGQQRMGVYGGYWAVKRALDAGIARYAWQTAAWSGGNIDPRIHLFQRIGTVTVDGVDCDVDEARKAEFGQHPAGQSPGGTMDEKSIVDYQVGTKDDGTPIDISTAIQDLAKLTTALGSDPVGKLNEAVLARFDTLAADVADLKVQVAELKAAAPKLSGSFSISGTGSVSSVG